MRVPKFVLAGLVGLATASPAFAGNILVMEDNSTYGTSAVAGAVALTPHTATYTTTGAAFSSALSQGGWDLVIFAEELNSQWAAASTSLTSYVNGGGKVIGCTWQTTGFAALLQGTRVGTNATPLTTTSHAIFANCGATIGLTNPGFGTWSVTYSPTGSATGLGTLGTASGVILGNNGNTLLNGPLCNTYATLSQGQQFLANEINFLITHVLTGRLLFDRYVVDATGIGNTSQQAVPLAGVRVDARTPADVTVGKTVTDDQGYFTLTVSGVNGSLVVCAENSATVLRAVAAGPPAYATFASTVSFATDQALGTITLGESIDPGGVARAPIQAARAIKEAYDWADARTTDTIPFLEVLYDPASTAPTSYTAKAGAVPATMRISASSENPDGWDLDVIRKTYARHLLGSIAAEPGVAANPSFDSLGTAENSFAEGFGYAFASILSGSNYYIDGTSSSAATVINLDGITTLQTAKSPNCPAWAAQGLFDLVDGANEAWDTVDGTASAGNGPASERVFTLVDSLVVPVTCTTFYSAWLAAGYDAAGITTDFLHHGLIPDDSDEPNDTPATAVQIGQFGFIRSGRTLNIANDDWYAFTLPEPTDAVTAVVSFNRVLYPSITLLLQITSAGGTVLATGTTPDTTSPYKAKTGALPAGKYLLRVRLATGGPLPSYTVQAFSTLAFRSDKFPSWTIGRPYNVNVSIVGGIPPYGLTIPSNHEGPQGLVLRGETGVVDGTPTGPPNGLAAGASKEYSFLLNAVDGASPANTASQLITFVLNDKVRSRFAEHAAFARGKSIDRDWPAVGGTIPYVVTLDEGGLPSGISIDAGERLAFTGTPDTPGSTGFKLTTTDLAGSAATSLATAVVCVPVGPADLAAGRSSCGFFFDVVKDSSTGLTITTAKKMPIRALRVAMYDVDGMRPLAITPRFGKGKVSFTKFIAPTSGRYFCVVSSDDELAATTFNCVQKTKNPAVGKGDAGTFSFGGDDRFELPMGVLNGGTITVIVKPDRLSGLRMKVLGLENPAGELVPLGETDVKVVAKTGQLTFTRKVDASGTWTVVLGAESGPRGTFKYLYKLKQPKGVVYSVD
jgi:hypothetical protein